MMGRMRKILAAAVLLGGAALQLSGCGYHVAGTTFAGNRPATVHVPVFANRTLRPVVDALLTNAVIAELSGSRGAWRIADDGAEYLLSGTVIACTSDAVAYSAADRVKGYRMTMTAEFTLQKMPEKAVVWKRSLTEVQDYPANAVVAFQQNSEDAAVRDLSARMARQVRILLLENF